MRTDKEPGHWSLARKMENKEKRSGDEAGATGLGIKGRRFEGMRASRGGEQRQELVEVRLDWVCLLLFSCCKLCLCSSQVRRVQLNKNVKCQDEDCPKNSNIAAFDRVPLPCQHTVCLDGG